MKIVHVVVHFLVLEKEPSEYEDENEDEDESESMGSCSYDWLSVTSANSHRL